MKYYATGPAIRQPSYATVTYNWQIIHISRSTGQIFTTKIWTENSQNINTNQQRSWYHQEQRMDGQLYDTKPTSIYNNRSTQTTCTDSPHKQHSWTVHTTTHMDSPHKLHSWTVHKNDICSWTVHTNNTAGQSTKMTSVAGQSTQTTQLNSP